MCTLPVAAGSSTWAGAGGAGRQCCMPPMSVSLTHNAPARCGRQRTHAAAAAGGDVRAAAGGPGRRQRHAPGAARERPHVHARGLAADPHPRPARRPAVERRRCWRRRRWRTAWRAPAVRVRCFDRAFVMGFRWLPWDRWCVPDCGFAESSLLGMRCVKLAYSALP